jgi:hypothetical protein
MGGTTQTQERTTSQQTQPWAPAQPVLTGILGQLGSVNPGLSGAETSALGGLSANSGFLNQFTPQATGLANTLLAGGGPDRSGMINDAYAQYQKSLQPFAGGDYVNPASNPALRGYLDTIQTDVSNQVNGMFAGAGRDLSGANLQTLARGIAQGEAPVLNDAYNTARNQQIAAINSLYGAGNTTGGLLSQFDQTRLANQQAGLGVAKTAQGFALDPYNQQLAIEAQRRGIPLSTLQALAGIATPIAGLGQSSTGTSTQTSSSPFNPLSLLPLALAPMTGGTSLAGMGASAAGGLFGNLFGGQNYATQPLTGSDAYINQSLFPGYGRR